MRIYALPLVLVFIGCQSNESGKTHPEPDSNCVGETNASYIESEDAEANALALENFSETRLEIVPSFDKTKPSNLDWRIISGKVSLDRKEYSLAYSDTASSWTVLNSNGAMVGNLTPYRTAGCAAVVQLKLTMFIPEEEASAYITFNSL
jgi:hypothetical protein